MINIDKVCEFGLDYVAKYQFDKSHYSFIFNKNSIVFIIDDNICKNETETVFDYSKYCEMQNKYSQEFDKLYRINIVDENDYIKIKKWLNKKPDDIEIDDMGGFFDTAHVDNTLLEKNLKIYLLKLMVMILLNI